MFGRSKRVAPAAAGAARTIQLAKDPSGRPAVDLTKVREAGAFELANNGEAAGISLAKRGLAGIRAQAVLVLDHSGSMMRDYQSGAVQALVERVLGFALQIDADGTVPVIAFDHKVRRAVEVTQANYRGVVEREIWRSRDMGTTNLAGALDVVRKMVLTTDLPMYVAIVTDGDPDDQYLATGAVCDLSRYPAFLKFLAVRPVDYLNELDDLDASMRLIDNVDTKPNDTGLDLLRCTDAQFQDAMADEWDSWFAAAQQAGVLT